MGFFGSLIGQGLGHILPFKKGGKVRKMQNGGVVLDAQDKMAIKALNNLIPMSKMKKGGKAKHKARK
jgi:hypothetical protein